MANAAGTPGAAGLLTPKRVFGAIAALLVIAMLFAPARDGASEAASLSTYSTDPNGARGLHDVLDRLGFTVERWLRPMREPLDTTRTYVLLDPPIPLTASEVSLLLDAVRAGASLLVMPNAGSRLADSLGIEPVPEMIARQRGTSRGRAMPIDSVMRISNMVRNVLRRPIEESDSNVVLSLPPGATNFLSVNTEHGLEPVIVGLPFGRGRVVVAAERSFFRNQRVREGEAGVQVVRWIEWLQTGDAARTIVFDEYHQGFGMHADILRVTRRALLETPAGRAALQLAAAALLLLLAIGVRPIRPRPQARIERRSALEHVGALARAYAAVRATDRAARLLVRGLRRRHGGLQNTRDEAAYLRGISTQDPAVAADVEQVVTTMEGTAPTNAAAELPSAIARIERVLTS